MGFGEFSEYKEIKKETDDIPRETLDENLARINSDIEIKLGFNEDETKTVESEKIAVSKRYELKIKNIEEREGALEKVRRLGEEADIDVSEAVADILAEIEAMKKEAAELGGEGIKRIPAEEKLKKIMTDPEGLKDGSIEKTDDTVEIEKKEWTPDSDEPPPLPEEEWDPNGNEPPPIQEEIITKNEEGEKAKFCTNCGKPIQKGANFCTECGEKVAQLNSKDKWDPNGDVPPPLPVEKIYKNESVMKERKMEKPELLSERGASKKFLAEERAKLAAEILAARKAQRERLSVSKKSIEDAIAVSEKIYGQQADEQYGKIAEMQSNEANELANRLESGLNEQNAEYEQENIAQLLSNSENIKLLKAKLQEHYTKADKIAKNKFESMQKTVEQTMLRNNVFIAHAILLGEERHNENSNISQRATTEDDLDILLSLEPSISTSSIIPGIRQGLWQENIGVLIGGGEIKGVSPGDDGTRTKGIKGRDGQISTSKEIDKNVSDRKERGYNELVVNNPKVFGFYQNVNVDEAGIMRGFTVGKYDNEEKIKSKKDNFMKFINIANQKGMPAFVMTSNRKVFEFVSIGEDGVISIGAEITPEQVATGKAGLSEEKRIELGENIISKNLFRKISDQKEAKQIVAELYGQENGEIGLSEEEYLDYIKSEPNISLHDFPENLLGNKEFLMKAAKLHSFPETIYEYASDNIREDEDFARYMHNLMKEKGRSSDLIYRRLPNDLRKKEEMALLAIENNSVRNNYFLEASLAESPIIWEKIIDGIVEGKDPRDWDYLNLGETKKFQGDFNEFFMKDKNHNTVNMSKKVLEDADFIKKLNTKFPKFKFEVENDNQVVVTRIFE